MKASQYWILVLGSVIISLLYIKQIFLTRELNHQQRNLVDSQQLITEGAQFESAWKQMAMNIYQVSRQDPPLADVLKKENIDVRPKAPKTESGTPPTTDPVLPSAPPKVAVPPSAPSAP